MVIAVLSIIISPLWTFLSPAITSASSAWPFPSTPAIPRISPFLSSSERSLRNFTFALLSADTFFSWRIAGFFADAFGSTLSMIDRPTIIFANSDSLESDVLTVPTTLPPRRTVTLLLASITSWSLCVMNIIERPCFTIDCKVANSAFSSCGVNMDVGSSRMRISISLYSAFTISTRCCSPTAKSAIVAFGSIFSPYFSAKYKIFFSALARSRNSPLDFRPTMIFSVTE